MENPIRPIRLALIALLCLVGTAFAQNPVSIRLEIYVVSEVTTSDGTREERGLEEWEKRTEDDAEFESAWERFRGRSAD
jgi:hypothetical protein